MPAFPIKSFLESLAKRRQALGMPWDALVARSGVPRATVTRLLNGHQGDASFTTAVAIAQALGVPVEFDGSAIQSKPIAVEEFMEQQADRQARRLVAMVQGTMGLESQALAEREASPLIRRTKRQLLAGAKKKLWYD
jgi:transcriptional regulator with XRE-family HTH domain